MFMFFVETLNDPDAVLAQQAADNEFYAAALREMIALGVEIGRIIHQQVVAQSIDSPHAMIDDQHAVAFERVFRAVRRGILLAQRLNEPAKPAQQLAKQLAKQPAQHPAAPRDTTRQDPRETNRTDPRDRMDTLDKVEELEDRPTAELLEQIREDLAPYANTLTRPDAPRSPPHQPSATPQAPVPPPQATSPPPQTHDTAESPLLLAGEGWVRVNAPRQTPQVIATGQAP